MELLTLDDDFQPVRMVENYNSLIWSERYSASGDFEVKSYDIKKAMQLLPLESFVAIRESVIPMLVEVHKIEKPKNQPAFVTITGRTFETILERRASVITLPSSAARAVWNINADRQSDAAYKAIRAVIGDRFARSILPILTPAISPLDEFVHADGEPMIDMTLPADFSTGLTTPYEIRTGDLYSVVMELLEASHHGIKSVRPLPGASDRTVNIEIYNGTNLTATVVFDARFDQIDAATYLLSYQGSTNIAYVYGGGAEGTSTGGVGPGATSVRKNTAGLEVASLDRRVLVVDEQSDATLRTTAIRTSRGLVELYKNNATAIFDGETSERIASFYNKPISEGGYGLGDIVRLNGEYGLSRDVRVAEFIRTSDNTGTKAYPAFQAVD